MPENTLRSTKIIKDLHIKKIKKNLSIIIISVEE